MQVSHCVAPFVCLPVILPGLFASLRPNLRQSYLADLDPLDAMVPQGMIANIGLMAESHAAIPTAEFKRSALRISRVRMFPHRMLTAVHFAVEFLFTKGTFIHTLS